MGAQADKLKRMTSDPGAQYLGQVADDQQALIQDLQTKLSALTTQVASCCGSEGPALKAKATAAAPTVPPAKNDP
jgi:hypothetical protein